MPWKQLPLGAGGWLVGLDVAPDGQILCRADTYGAYIFDKPTKTWRQFCQSGYFPGGNDGIGFSGTGQSVNQGGGVWEICAAPSNSAVIYMVWSNKLWNTSDRAHWTRMTYPGTRSIEGNGTYRYGGRRMAVDPANSSHVIFGSQRDGVFRCTDGAAFVKIPVNVLPMSTPDPADWKNPINPITNAVWSSANGGQITFTVQNGGTAFVNVGTPFVVANCWPDAYNGDYVSVTGSSGNTVVVAKTSNPGAASSFGQMFYDAGNGVGSPETPAYNVAFDTSSGTTGGKTNRIYIFVNTANDTVYTGGLYVSEDCGVTWNKISGTGPTSCGHLICAQNGVVWMCDMTGGAQAGNLWNFVRTGPHAGTFTLFFHTQGLEDQFLQCVAVDPSNANRVLALDGGGTVWFSANAGTSWGANKYTHSAADNTDIPWLDDMHNSSGYFCPGDMIFDPTGTNELIASNGIGVWHGNPSSSVAWNFNSMSKGIEQLCAMTVMSPNGFPLVGVLDRMIFKLDTVNFPSVQSPHNSDTLNVCMSMDWVASNKNFLVACNAPWAGTASPYHCYSIDGGDNWIPFSRWHSKVPYTALSDNGSGQVRVTVPSTAGMTTWSAGTGDIVSVTPFDGASSLVQQFPNWFNYQRRLASRVVKINSTQFDMLDCDFRPGQYTAGSYMFYVSTMPRGTWAKQLSITGIVNDGTGKIKITTAQGSWIVGDDLPFTVEGVTGCTEANGEWLPYAIDNGAAAVTLAGSTFTHAYTGGGTIRVTLGPGTKICAASETEILCVPALKEYPMLSHDGGLTWTEFLFPAGVAMGDDTGWGWYWPWYQASRYCFVADRNADGNHANTFYLYGDRPGIGQYLYKLQNGTFTAMSINSPFGYWTGWHAKMTQPYTHSGHLFFTAGPGGGTAHPDSNTSLYHSMDEGVTWHTIPGVLECYWVSSGAKHPSSDYATIYINGWVNNVYGYWRATATYAQWAAADGGNSTAVTWTFLGDYPNGAIGGPSDGGWGDGVNIGSADQVYWDRMYTGFGGSGFFGYAESWGASTDMVRQPNKFSVGHTGFAPTVVATLTPPPVGPRKVHFRVKRN